MAEYRATRNEPRVGVGDWTGDFRLGVTYEAGDNPGQVPEYICDYLVSHGLLVDSRVATGPSASPAPPVGPTPPKVTPIKQEA
jgi:hypothetical protein